MKKRGSSVSGLVFIFFILIIILFVLSCTPAEKAVQKEQSAAEKIHTQKGITLSPKSFGAEDFTDFLSLVKIAGNTLSWAGDWKELAKEQSAPAIVMELASKYGYTPVIEVTYFQPEGKLIRPLTPEIKEEYLKSMVSFAEKYKPKYLGIGIEVNIVYEKSGADYKEFVQLYKEAYSAVKEKSPETKVFTIFQLEKMKGGTFWSSGLDTSKSQWSLLEQFELDLVAFTTYPNLIFKDPADIPEDYYSEIKEHTAKPLVFTEIGWPSELEVKGWESDQKEQAEFVSVFFQRIKKLSPEMLIWSFMYDQKTIEPFQSMGLRNEEGTERPAWGEWIKS